MVAHTVIEVYQNAVMDILSRHATKEDGALSLREIISLVQEKYADYTSHYIKIATGNLVLQQRVVLTNEWRHHLPE